MTRPALSAFELCAQCAAHKAAQQLCRKFGHMTAGTRDARDLLAAFCQDFNDLN